MLDDPSPWRRSAESISFSTRSNDCSAFGATGNLLNLLQKQHPADLAQIFSELQDKEKEATFSLLAERNGRLAMEAVSELGPEAGASLGATGVIDFPNCMSKLFGFGMTVPEAIARATVNAARTFDVFREPDRWV